MVTVYKSSNKGGLASAPVTSEENSMVSMVASPNEKGSVLLSPRESVTASWFSKPIAMEWGKNNKKNLFGHLYQ